MDAALAWVGQVAEWFGRFIPRREILDTTEGAIKYRGGSTPIFCGPGVHWWWPWRSTWTAFPMARQSDRLETQTLESSDGKSFIVSGTLTYAVEDLSKLVPTTYSAVTTILEIASTAIADVTCDMEWAELLRMQRRGTLKTMLKNSAQRELDEYGIRVIRFKLNSLARCRVIKVSQSTATEDN